MQPLNAHIDFELDDVSAETQSRLQSAVAQEVAAARAVVVSSLSREEAERTPGLIRTKINLLPKHLTSVRTVDIVGLDLQADGGTHVANTSEVGECRITRLVNKGRQNKRLYIELS